MVNGVMNNDLLIQNDVDARSSGLFQAITATFFFLQTAEEKTQQRTGIIGGTWARFEQATFEYKSDALLPVTNGSVLCSYAFEAHEARHACLLQNASVL
jgi:hypothetical protein